MQDSGRVLRHKIQAILGQIHAPVSKDEKRSGSAPGDVSTGAVTPAVETSSPASTGRMKSVDEILSLIDGQCRRSTGSVREGPSKAELGFALERSQAECRELQTQLAHVRDTQKRHQDRISERVEILTAENEALKRDLAEQQTQLATKVSRDDDLVKSHIEREKQSIIAKERSQRKKWEEKRIAEIKEQTINSLAPEMERMLNTHKAEKKIIYDQHGLDLDALRQQHASELRSALQEAQKRATSEILAAVENERTLFRKKDADNFNSFLKQLEEERDRARLRMDEAVTDAKTELKAELENVDEKLRVVTEQRDEFAILVQRAAIQQKNDSAAIVRLDDQVAEIASKLAESAKANTQLQEELSLERHKVQTLENLEAERVESIQQLECELDQTRFEKASLVEQLKIANNDLEVFKTTELASIEASVRRLVDEKNKEIDELMERVQELELRRQT